MRSIKLSLAFVLVLLSHLAWPASDIGAFVRLVEPDADHLNAPAASVGAVVEWIRAVASAK